MNPNDLNKLAGKTIDSADLRPAISAVKPCLLKLKFTDGSEARFVALLDLDLEFSKFHPALRGVYDEAD